MIIDTSVIICMLLNEPESDEFMQKTSNAGYVAISAATLAEAYLVTQSKFREETREACEAKVDEILVALQIEVLPFNLETSRMASAAFARYGKGNHPAKLNFGDCLTYAAAKQCGEPLLFKGSDFDKTDIELA